MMLESSKDNLFVLIKSLSSSEKRQFTLYVNRFEENSNAKFMQLFSLLDKQNSYNERIILDSKIVTKQQLSNLKAHLYKQILVSLRTNPVNQNIRILIREQLDFATILYNKGLHKQSLKILDKAKQTAVSYDEKNIAFEIVELEKVIESQFITRSASGRADELTIMAMELSKQNIISSKLSNLSLQLYNKMLKSGYAKNSNEIELLSTYFTAKMPKYRFDTLGFREKLWLYQTHLWFNFMVQDFLMCYKYASRWVGLFADNSQMVYQNPVWYLKGTSYYLECLFLIKHQTKMKLVLNNLENTINAKEFPKNENLQSLYFICANTAKLNLYFMDGSFSKGIYLVNDICKGIQKHKNSIDLHHIMVFYYKIACMYFGAGAYKNCIIYLQKIISNKNGVVRDDLICFARVLNLMAHFDAGFDENLPRLLATTHSFLLKMNELHKVQTEILASVQKLLVAYPQDVKSELSSLYTRLKVYENHPFEKRAFLYLDILSWIESKIQNKPVAQIIAEKSKKVLK